MFYLICYDIFDTRRRNRVARLLEGFGTRVQDSVFECQLDGERLARLKRRLARRIDSGRDKIRYYPLCGRDMAAIIIAGKGEVSRDDIYWQL
jgi:CRISPR-associated protein Cas2